MVFEYSVQRTFTEAIDVVDIGNTALKCTGSSLDDYYIVLKTIMGKTSIIKFGPVCPDIEILLNDFTVTYKKMDYKESGICKEIDKFIATLDVAERNQFASLYVLKLKDVMPEIPAYEIGGDNRYFFEMVFITLGEYRDDIPDGLLQKMYIHMCVEYPQMEVPAV
jgi:hypothetical protein